MAHNHFHVGCHCWQVKNRNKGLRPEPCIRFETHAREWNALMIHNPSQKWDRATKPGNGQCLICVSNRVGFVLFSARFVHQRPPFQAFRSTSQLILARRSRAVVKDTPEAQKAARELLAKSVREGIQSKAKSYEERDSWMGKVQNSIALHIVCMSCIQR